MKSAADGRWVAWTLWTALCVGGCGSTVTSTDASGVDAIPSSDQGVVAVDAGSPIDAPAPMDVVEVEDASVREDADEPLPTDAGVNPASDRPDVMMADVPGAACASATLVRDGDVLMGQAFGGTSSVPSCNGSFARVSPTRWYRATVPADGVLEVTVPDGQGSAVELSALESCEATTCLAGTRGGRELGPLVFHNGASSARTVFVAVINLARVPAPLTVAVRIRGASANSTCAAATPLVEGITLRGQDLGLSAENAVNCYDPSDRGVPALFYTVTVPPRTALLARALRTSTAASVLYSYVRPACGEPGCLATAFTRLFSSGEAIGQFNNASDAPRSVSVAIGSAPEFARPVVDVTATFRALPANARCNAPITLTSGIAARLEHPEDATDATPRCPGASDVPPRAMYYDIVVPAGQTLTAGLSSALDGHSPYGFVRLFTGCGGVCLASSSAELSSSRALYVNANPVAQRVLIAAGSARTDRSPPLELRATLRPTSANLDCAGAVALSPASPARDIDLLEAHDPDPCGGTGGPVLYYAVAVPAGATLTVQGGVAPARGGPSISLLGGCGGVCLAQSRPTGEATSSLVYSNRGADRSLIVAVGTGAYPADPATPVNVSVRVE
ncbi:MAG: hypothetical protein EPO40_31195 [Myxococcaceae bacterium]|nr:MAG: hypothetical protein EPO40_31195 [Myxococcaceae bacterium]